MELGDIEVGPSPKMDALVYVWDRHLSEDLKSEDDRDALLRQQRDEEADEVAKDQPEFLRRYCCRCIPICWDGPNYLTNWELN